MVFFKIWHGAGNQYSLNLRLPSTVILHMKVKFEMEIIFYKQLQLLQRALQRQLVLANTLQLQTDLQDGLRILGNTTTTVGSTWYTKAQTQHMLSVI